MAKGKRELIVEIGGDQLHLAEFKKLLENKLKEDGNFKFTEDVKMYFNVSEQTVYCVSADGKQLKINF